MDANSILTSVGISTTLSTIITIIYHVFQKMNGKMLHSKCCSHDIEMGVEVVDMDNKNKNSHQSRENENERITNQSNSQ